MSRLETTDRTLGEQVAGKTKVEAAAARLDDTVERKKDEAAGKLNDTADQLGDRTRQYGFDRSDA